MVSHHQSALIIIFAAVASSLLFQAYEALALARGGPSNSAFPINQNPPVVTSPISSNHPPTATDQSVTTKQNTPSSITLAGSDPDQNSTLTAAIITKPSQGTLGTINEDIGTVTYTPNPGFTGSDSFRFKVNDGTIDSKNAGIVNITVGGS